MLKEVNFEVTADNEWGKFDYAVVRISSIEKLEIKPERLASGESIFAVAITLEGGHVQNTPFTTSLEDALRLREAISIAICLREGIDVHGEALKTA